MTSRPAPTLELHTRLLALVLVLNAGITLSPVFFVVAIAAMVPMGAIDSGREKSYWSRSPAVGLSLLEVAALAGVYHLGTLSPFEAYSMLAICSLLVVLVAGHFLNPPRRDALVTVVVGVVVTGGLLAAAVFGIA